MRYNAQLYLTMQHCYSLLVDLASGKSFISSLLCSIITIYRLTQVQRRVSSPLYYAALLQSTGLLKLREEFHLLFTMQHCYNLLVYSSSEKSFLSSRALIRAC